MSVQTIEGIVKNGQIVVSPEITLPESTSVTILVKNGDSSFSHMRSPRLVNRHDATDFDMQLIEEKPDA